MSKPNDETAIQLEDVSFTYSVASEPILKHISLEVKKGELIGLVGPTGSGKTTLLNVIAGVSPHYYPGELEGRVSIFGKSTLEMSMAQNSIIVGLVMQDPDSQLFNLFVRDEVIWGLENLGVPREKIAEIRATASKKFRIDHLLDRITYDLSGGEKQLTAITSTFMMSPKILLFDNPTSALDPLGTEMVFEAIQELRRDDPEITIIVNDDKVQELAAYTERMWLIDDGEIKIDAKPEDFFTNGKALGMAKINMPMVTQVAYELSQRGLWEGKLPLTVEQFMSFYSEQKIAV